MSADALSPADLRLVVEPASLGFEDTTALADEPLPWIGQERAERAARFGLQVDQPGWNLFVLGEVGSGRATLLRQLMAHFAASRPVPPDLCYLHDFDAPGRPRALRLPAGEGRLLRQLMADFAKRSQVEIPKRLVADDVRAEVERIERACKAEEDRAFAELSAFADARRFALMREEGRLVFTRRDDAGAPMTADAAMSLTPQQRLEIDAAEGALTAEIARFLESARAQELAVEERLQALRRRKVKPLVDHALQEIRNALRRQIKDSVKLASYLEQVGADILANLELFQPVDDEDEADRVEALLEVLSRLRVNVAVDHHGASGAPVIVEDNPQLRTLFGSIEYEAENDVLVTDFSRVRAGSLLQAHGGFLMLHLRDLLADPPVWERLRRFLRSGRLQVGETGGPFAPIAAVSLQPEAVEVDVKIVLVASVEDYYLVQEGDPEFARHFRCKVDFAESFRASDDTRRATAVFVAHACDRLGLPHCSAAAVATLIEAMHRDAEDRERQSARFARAEALLVESAAQARARGQHLIDTPDVRAAIEAAAHRHDYPEQRLHESLRDGERVVLTGGEAVGQVNGLTVVDLGDHAFGFPIRVTASTRAGDEGLLDIEREVELSGPIHDKGVLILHGHLASLFARIAPLALAATVVFEQQYGGIEGDSASCAEFLALLSSLAGVPLRQGIAVTGAIDSRGDLLPVGGINEKIEGWFRACETLGLDGRQGVVIPARNCRHLMLAPRVVDAVAAGRFHVHAARRAGDAMTLLSGLAYDVPGLAGYAPDSVLGRAERTLRAYRRACDALPPRRALAAARARRPRG